MEMHPYEGRELRGVAERRPPTKKSSAACLEGGEGDRVLAAARGS